MDSATTAAGIELDGAFAGQQYRQGDDGYDAARAIYNAMVDKGPRSSPDVQVSRTSSTRSTSPVSAACR